MSREIKFRAWDPSESRMVQFGDDDFWYMSMFDDKPRAIGCHNAGSDPDSDIDDAVILQYTGLKDKHGVEIYEGDIIRATAIDGYLPTMNDITIVEYNPGYFFTNDELAWHELEVIGNIYQNPELLEAVL